jgi:predicted ATPase with chaperone activity
MEVEIDRLAPWPLGESNEKPRPAMNLPEAIDTTCLHRVVGRTGAPTALANARPCRASHHAIPDVGRSGGGHGPLPAEVSLAHHGVLFLDARPECRRHVLEVVRPPPEEGVLSTQSPERHQSNCFPRLGFPRNDRAGVGQGP